MNGSIVSVEASWLLGLVGEADLGAESSRADSLSVMTKSIPKRGWGDRWHVAILVIK